MPFSVLTDNPSAWGCKHILVLASAAGAELYIPSAGLDEAALVPWQDHVSKRVLVRLRPEGQEVTHAIPLSVDTLRTFSIAGIDRRRMVNQALRNLRREAKGQHKHFWQIIAVAGRAGGRHRLIWRAPIEFSDRATVLERLQLALLPFFREGGELQMDEEVNFFVLSADDRDGVPPTLEELTYVNAIFNYALQFIHGDPARYPGRKLVMLVKNTSTPAVADLLFAYDPWEDDRRAWPTAAPQRPPGRRTPTRQQRPPQPPHQTSTPR